MKVLLLNTSERTGGAAIAANRLMKALASSEIEASMLVLNKQTDDESVISVQRTSLDRLKARWYFYWERFVIFVKNGFDRKNLFRVSIANTGFDISEHPLVQSADIIHLHWINQGFLSLKNIKQLLALNKPIVWTMHDMWPVTGICHHAWDCDRYQSVCGQCPFLNSTRKADLSYSIFQYKQDISPNIRFVAVSSWLKQTAEQSAVLKGQAVKAIPNVIDTNVFYPHEDKAIIKGKWQIRGDKKIVLMGAQRLDDPIKGLDALQQALLLLSQKRDNLLILLFGNYRGDENLLHENIPFELKYVGEITDASSLAELYSIADVTVMPSYFETFGQTLIESMACGCPVVSFDNSGQTDIIDHLENGYLAKSGDVNDLAEGIANVLEETNHARYSRKAIEKVHWYYSETIVAKQYITLYKSLLQSN